MTKDSDDTKGMAGIELPTDAANHELAQLLGVLWELEIPKTPPSHVFSPSWGPNA